MGRCEFTSFRLLVSGECPWFTSSRGCIGSDVYEWAPRRSLAICSYALAHAVTESCYADEVRLNFFMVGVIMIMNTRMIILNLPSVSDDRRSKCIGSPLYFRGLSRSAGISRHFIDGVVLNFIINAIKNIRDTSSCSSSAAFPPRKPAKVVELPSIFEARRKLRPLASRGFARHRP